MDLLSTKKTCIFSTLLMTMLFVASPTEIWPQEDNNAGDNSTEQVENEDSEENTRYVKVDSTSPAAVVQDDTDFFESNPVARLVSNQPVTLLGEEKDGYVKIKARVDGEEIEGWIKKIVLSDEPIQNKPRVSEAGSVDSAAFAAPGSVGVEPIDTTGMKKPDTAENPWAHIDPTSAEAKMVSSPVPYHLIIPGALIVGGGALVAILAATRDDPDPDIPDENPPPEDPAFSLFDDDYSIFCGQTLNIFPLQNDEGTGLIILEINNPPAGIQLLNDSTILVSSGLNEDVSFSIVIEDSAGQMGSSTVTITVEDDEIAANDETYQMNPGEIISGNVLDNDLCFGCSVIDAAGEIGTLNMQENGEFDFSVQDDFTGEAVYVITIENPCGAQATSNLVFIVNPEPPCAFEWSGSIQVVSADCGLSNGAAFATEELFGPYNFSWSNGVDVPENEDIAVGTYELIVTDTTFGCTDTVVAEVDQLPADYSAEASLIEGGCGETDNVQLNTNAGVANPLTVSLSGSTSGSIENVTDPSILLGDMTALNPGNLTITIWSELQGFECSQSLDVNVGQGPPIPEVIVTDVVQPEPPENVGTIVLDIINAALPADVIVNGEVLTTAMAPQVVLEGFPPGAYLITVIDLEGCESLPVEIMLEGQGINPITESLKWSPQTMGLTNWIATPAELLLQTREGQDYFTPVASASTAPIYVEVFNGNWTMSGAYSQTAFRGVENGAKGVKRGHYYELATGGAFKILDQKCVLKIGYAEWQLATINKQTANAWFVDGSFHLPIQNLSGRLQLGVRAGKLNTVNKMVVLPKVQWIFGP